MNCLVQLILIFIFLIFSTYAKADDWDKYLHLMDRFYSLDNQRFESISCNIEVPLTKNFVKQLHDQFDSRKDKIELKENLSEFSLTYSRGSGLKFKYPLLEAKIISEEGVADPSKLRKGVEMVNAGFKQQIEGTVMQLQGLFQEFETPKKSAFKIIEIKEDEDSYTIVYEKDNYNVAETYSKNQRKTILKSKDGSEMSSLEDYRKIEDGKMLFTSASARFTNSISDAEMDMTVSYEKVKDILFPSRILGRFKQTIQTIRQEGEIVTRLNNCILR